MTQLVYYDTTVGDLGAEHPRWTLALPVLQELRPHLTPALLRQVLSEPGPPTFTALFTRAGECVCVAGWRVVPTTANSSGRRLHVDDLVTAAAHRGSGYGGYLLDILEERARSANCALLELDSGLHRTAAHGFYRARGMRHTCHHYGKPTR